MPVIPNPTEFPSASQKGNESQNKPGEQREKASATDQHLLDESLGFLLVGEGQPRRTVLKLKGMKEGAVLVVSEVIVKLLVPNYASVHGLPQAQRQQVHLLKF